MDVVMPPTARFSARAFFSKRLFKIFALLLSISVLAYLIYLGYRYIRTPNIPDLSEVARVSNDVVEYVIHATRPNASSPYTFTLENKEITATFKPLDYVSVKSSPLVASLYSTDGNLIAEVPIADKLTQFSETFSDEGEISAGETYMLDDAFLTFKYDANVVVGKIVFKYKDNLLGDLVLNSVTEDTNVLGTAILSRNNFAYLPDDNTFDILVIPDGYFAEEEADFFKYFQQVKDILYSLAPYSELGPLFKMHAKFFPSAERVPNSSTPGDTAFKLKKGNRSDQSFPAFYNKLQTHAWEVDMIGFVYVGYGPTWAGGFYGSEFYIGKVQSTVDSENLIFHHELGHSLGGMGDEYFKTPHDYRVCSPHGILAWYDLPNWEVHTSYNDIKWSHFIDPDTPLPTDIAFSNIVGLYTGADGCHHDFYRPTYNSLMRNVSMGQVYNPPSAESVAIQALHRVDILSNVMPLQEDIYLGKGGVQTFSISSVLSNVTVIWELDGTQLNTTEFEHTLKGDELSDGVHKLTATIDVHVPSVLVDKIGSTKQILEWNVHVDSTYAQVPYVIDVVASGTSRGFTSNPIMGVSIFGSQVAQFSVTSEESRKFSLNYNAPANSLTPTTSDLQVALVNGNINADPRIGPTLNVLGVRVRPLNTYEPSLIRQVLDKIAKIISPVTYAQSFEEVTPTDVNKSVFANFSAQPVSGDAPLNVVFTDASKGAVVKYSWDFGDGNKSSERNPTHKYTVPGEYLVTLEVFSEIPDITSTFSSTITVTTPPPGKYTADFYAPVTSGVGFLSVFFQDRSTGFPSKVFWDFGDGSTSTNKAPSHNYKKPGVYTVSLTVGDDYVTDTATKEAYITVEPLTPTHITPIITPSRLVGVIPFTSDFSIDHPEEIGINYYGFDITPVKQFVGSNFNHTFSQPGTFQLNLLLQTASNWRRKFLYGFPDIVTAVLPSQLPYLDFGVPYKYGQAPYTVTFTNNSLGEFTSWKWDFGDGNYSTDEAPAHTYVVPGTYSVTLTGTTASSPVSKTIENIVTVVDSLTPPNASFTVDNMTGVSPLFVNLVSTSTGYIDHFIWHFYDTPDNDDSVLVSLFGAERYPFKLESIGSYNFGLTVRNSAGSSTFWFPDSITVLDKPKVLDFYTSAFSGNAPLDVRFINTSTSHYDDFAWDFGDGFSSSEKHPSHTYTSPGTYKVTLTSNGDSKVREDYVVVTETDPITDLSTYTSPINYWSLGSFGGANGCGAGFKDSTKLHCTGYFDFSKAKNVFFPTQGSTLSIYAAGSTKRDGYANMQVLVKDELVAEFHATTTTGGTPFQLQLPEYIDISDLKIKFTNDDNPEDYAAGQVVGELVVRMTILDGIRYPTEFFWVEQDAPCKSGFTYLMFLFCNGYVDYSKKADFNDYQPQYISSSITLTASGLSGILGNFVLKPNVEPVYMSLEIDGKTVKIFELSSEVQEYKYQHLGTRSVDIRDVKVSFRNRSASKNLQGVVVDKEVPVVPNSAFTSTPDILQNNFIQRLQSKSISKPIYSGDGKSYYLKNIEIDGVNYNPSQYWSYGGWDLNSGCGGGYKKTNYLVCTGYFDFSKHVDY
ncbi:MAG: PKD domain-containing protein [Patescibacteria group bacterium]